jgi:SAM-dependent methyltransferase
MKRENSCEIRHYDEIPAFVFKNANLILDVGCNDGYGAFHSKHRDSFLENAYLGLDVQAFQYHYLERIICCDFLKFETGVRFSLIIFSHVLEHFSIDMWPLLFTKLRGLLAPGGYLVVGVPYAQKEPIPDHAHRVLDITPDLLRDYCPFQHIIKAHNPTVFRSPGEGLLRATLRFGYRILSHHQYSVLKTLKPVRLIAVYQND